MEGKKITGILITTKEGLDHTFIYEYVFRLLPSIKSYVYLFDIWATGKDEKPKFSFILRVMENDKDLKVIDLLAPDYYKGYGISIAIILTAKKLFNKRITSSSNKNDIKSFITEARKLDATEKVWKRMVQRGLAEYDKANDYYYTL